MERYQLHYVLEKPGIFRRWRPALVIVGGCMAFWLLVGAAIFELVRW
jgi:hypothetical protein